MSLKGTAAVRQIFSGETEIVLPLISEGGNSKAQLAGISNEKQVLVSTTNVLPGVVQRTPPPARLFGPEFTSDFA